MILLDSILSDDRHIATYSGRQLCLLDPDPSQIDIEDIAHGLAYQGCLNGQTRYFYSLAQHSMTVANLVPPPQRLAALLHDAAAAYLGEMTKPMHQLCPEFLLIEKKIMAAVSKKFAVFGFDSPAIQRAHLVAQATELRDLRPNSPEPCTTRGRSVPIPRRIEFKPPEEAKYEYTEMFTDLIKKSPAGQKHLAIDWVSERSLPADRNHAFRQAQLRTGSVALAR